MFKQDLSLLSWSVSPIGNLSEVPAGANRTMAAQVPGCIHLDLIRAGIIKHPREGFAELDQFWVGKTDWRFECRFEADPILFEHERIDLVCEGLDTITLVELNGQVIGAAANMFHPHRFRLNGLRRTDNHLAVTFKSPLRHIREEEARLGSRPVNGDWDPYIFIRKCACNFGWDFAPKVPTCGVWKPIRLEAWSGVRIAGVRPLVWRAGSDRWCVSVEADLERADPEWVDHPPPEFVVQASLELNGIVVNASSVAEPDRPSTISFDVENPKLWWPRGHGEQPLYHLEVSLHGDGETDGLPEGWAADIGFREIRLNTEPDEHGSKFQIEVNGKPIFCKGANWVPDALFPTEVTPDRYREQVKQAADANMNMLRVWGGGYYEDEEFYRVCDELGILVWQDFMFACAMYPEEAPYPALVEAEARHQITRLSSHPSVALWCGGNECVWAYESWGNAPGETPWKRRLGDKTWGRGYYFDLLPRLVAELDPTRPYWANSPWSGSQDVTTNGERHGDRHTWDVRMEGYRTVVPRFCSEFGQQAPSDRETLWRVIPAEQLGIDSPALEHRQRATGGTVKHIQECLAEHRAPPTRFLEWHVAVQHLQSLALKTGIDWLRINHTRCKGVLLWQLNEPWPGLAWGIIDSDGRPKQAWMGVEVAFRPRRLTIQPFQGKPVLYAINDGLTDWSTTISVSRRDYRANADLAIASIAIAVPAASVNRIADLEDLMNRPADVRREWFYAKCEGCDAPWHYVKDKDRLPAG